MIYKHEWANDWARYAAKNITSIVEFRTKKERDLFIKVRQFAVYKFEELDRYTDQQMELEALNEGWVLWSAGDGKPDLNECTAIEITLSDDGGDTILNTHTQINNVNWAPRSAVAAWRLSNADGYKEEVKVESNMTACCVNCSHEWRILDSNLDSEPCPKCHDVPTVDSNGYNRDSDEVFGKKLSVESIPIERDDISYKKEYDEAMREATDLALFLHKKHYKKESPEFNLCDSPAGILSQIDNMVCGLVKEGVNSLSSTAWIDGLPPVGEVCEGYVCLSPAMNWEWKEVEILKHIKNECAVYLEEKGRVTFCDQFRPIPDKKQQVIEKATSGFLAAKTDSYNYNLTETLECLYDLGMLIEPDKEDK